MDITYFYGPPDDCIVREEVIRAIAEAGFTLIPLEAANPEVNKAALRLCGRYGLKALVRDGRIERFLRRPEERPEAAVAAMVADYAAFDNVQGWYITDEPHTGDFPRLAEIASAFRRAAPGREVYINLFPDYADPGMLRAVDYASYLRLFVETVRPEILSYDYYPFLGRDRSVSADKLFLVETERERGIRQAAARMEDRTEFFRNLGAIREAGLEAGIPTMLILQLTEHGYYRNPTKEELLWQVTHALAYGVSRISYFTYWLPDSDDGFWLWDNAMVERDGSPNPHYHQVREINRRLRSLGKALEGRTSEAVFHADPAEPYGLPLRSHGALRSLSGGAAVVGFFDDGSFLVTNKDFRAPAVLELEITGEPAYWDEKEEDWRPCREGAPLAGRDGTYRLRLEPGDGLLIRAR